MKTLLQIFGGAIVCILIAFSPFEYRIIKNVYQHGYHTRYVNIDQEVAFAKVINNTYYVDTKVITSNIIGGSITIEWSALDRVSINEIESTKYKQMITASVIKDKVEKILYER